MELLQSLYPFILSLHILFAVVCFGPCFVQPVLVHSAKAPHQFLWMSSVGGKFSRFYKTGDWGLAISGLLMYIVGKWDLSHVWLDAAVLLFIGMRVIAKFEGRAYKKISAAAEANDQEAYTAALKEDIPYAAAIYACNFLIVAMMVFKPF